VPLTPAACFERDLFFGFSVFPADAANRFIPPDTREPPETGKRRAITPAAFAPRPLPVSTNRHYLRAGDALSRTSTNGLAAGITAWLPVTMALAPMALP